MQKMQRKFIHVGLLLILIPLLQSCVSTAVTGASAVYNRKQIQSSLNDQYITLQAYQKIDYDSQKRFKNSNIAITTFNKVVLLTGQVQNKQLRSEAEHIVQQIDGIKKIYNLTTISEPASTLIQTSDAWITAKIKSKYMASEDVDPTHIKVVTDNGTVFLLGTLQPAEANAAVAFAQTTEGVQNVVKIFEYLEVVHRQG